MQIRTLFLACMSVVAAFAACLGCWVLTQMVVEYRIAGVVEHTVKIDTLIFKVTDKIGLERPVVGDALLVDQPLDSAGWSALGNIRRAADAALDEAEAAIAASAGSGTSAQLTIVRQIRVDLLAWRQQVDAALRRPKAERDPAIFAHFIATLNKVFDATSIPLDIADPVASQHDGRAIELITLARQVWGIRMVMGSRTVPLMAAIDRGAMLTHDELEAQARFDGQISAGWEPIIGLSRGLTDEPALSEAIASGRAAFEAYNLLCTEVITTGRSSSHYQIAAIDLGRDLVKTAPRLLQIRDQALAAAYDRVTDKRELAAVHVLSAGFVLVLTIISMVGVLILLQRRIVSPVLALTEAISRIAKLDFDVKIPERERSDEIGRMADALDALRSGAMAGEEHKAQVVHLARHDALTGLPNRLMLQERLELALALAERGQTAAVLCLDLDRFKAVNDTFGHPTGDKLLRSVAERLTACVREVDVVCRIDGDEFVVLLIGIDVPEQATTVANRIIHVLNEPFSIDGQILSIGTSVGIAFTPKDARTAVDILKCADTALYRAKNEQMGSWRFFEPKMDEQLQQRAILERELRDAVQAQSFELHYQPCYHLKTDRLSAFEALVRWRHPRNGLISPATFIPVAEETGLIVAIGEWVLRQGCVQAAQWPDHVKVAINISAVQLKHPGLLQMVKEALANSRLPPRRLELEITETVLLKETGATLNTLHALRDLGIQIVMDDFGTGYSSLSYLRRFPFDTIKIDQSFVRDLSDHPDSVAIVRAIVALAGSLGMTTTAEGIETDAQLAVLRAEGCTEGQGYLFSKPVPVAELPRLLSASAVTVEA